MTRILVPAAMIALSILFIALVFPYLVEPVVFTAEDVRGSGDHYNPLAFTDEGRPRGGEVLPLMGELLNGTGKVAITIGAGNLERAEEELRRLLRLSRHFDTLVIELNVTEGDLRRFQEEHRENLNELKALLQESRELEGLKQVEIRRPSGEVPGQVEFAVYRGASIRTAIEQAYTRLSNRSASVLDLSRRLGVDAGEYEEGLGSLNRVVEEAREAEETLSSRTGAKAPPALFLEVSPARVHYGEFLEFRGRALAEGEADGRVELFVDGIRIASVAVGGEGVFEHRALIRESSAGEHIAIARQGGLLSPQARFTIEEAEALLTLEARERRRGGEREVVCTGALNASGLPVVGARIELRRGEEVFEARTDADGHYAVNVSPLTGEQTFLACFGGEGYPLRPVCSAPVHLLVKPEWPLAHTLVYLLFAGASLLGVVAWRRWRRRREEETAIPRHVAPAPSAGAAEGVQVASAAPVPSLPEEAIARAGELLGRGDASEAAFLLYTDLLTRIPAFGGVKRIRTLTPREAAALLQGDPQGEAFARFVHVYERVRYGGQSGIAGVLIEHYNEALPARKEGGA